MKDLHDIVLHDPQQLEEIEMLGDLIAMATDSDRPLSQSDIDETLGVAQKPVDASF